MTRVIRMPLRARRSLPAVMLASAILASCGGSRAEEASSSKEAAQPAEAGSDGSTTTTGSGRASAAKSRAQTPTTAPAANAKGSKESSASSAENDAGSKKDPWSEKMEITVTLKEACVRPGGTQTITIGAPPASGVGYNTYYSDGKSGLSEGFYGGNKGGFTDESGTWTDTWVIAPQAPAGQAVVAVLATGPVGGRGEDGAVFWVADLTGLCPS